jgi:L,D-peptidoglycan transpeptidase YkuD (ErfK/YbiS/YcfS/YnhG family)
MIVVKKSGHLKYKNFKFRCSLGKNGIKKKIKEGDNITPSGIFRIKKLYYRADRIKKIVTSVKKIKIKKNIGWCDDFKSADYNKEIKLPSKFSHEKLYRKDHLYDLVVVINYNMNPIIKKRGSAIFIHIERNNYQPTQGCIGLKKKHLLTILKNIKKNEKIKII